MKTLILSIIALIYLLFYLMVGLAIMEDYIMKNNCL